MGNNVAAIKTPLRQRWGRTPQRPPWRFSLLLQTEFDLDILPISGYRLIDPISNQSTFNHRQGFYCFEIKERSEQKAI
jgi:hypothetical protein